VARRRTGALTSASLHKGCEQVAPLTFSRRGTKETRGREQGHPSASARKTRSYAAAKPGRGRLFGQVIDVGGQHEAAPALERSLGDELDRFRHRDSVDCTGAQTVRLDVPPASHSSDRTSASMDMRRSAFRRFV